MRDWALLLAIAVSPAPAAALDFDLRGASVERVEVSAADSVRLPRAPWSEDRPFPVAEGAVRKTVYKYGEETRTTLQILTPFRAALEEAGYTEVFSCADQACGGFDFRFQLDILGEPEMHVDLGDFRYLLMQRSVDAGDPHTVSVVTSRSASEGFAHVTEVSKIALLEPAPISSVPDAARPPNADGDLVSTLVSTGHVILDDLDFASGSASLTTAEYQSLASLAAWMSENPQVRIALVGHTDAVGSRDANRALSRSRAETVLARIRDGYGIAADRLEADGVGYLAPRAPSTTAEGRALNRRVEAVLLSTE